MNDVPLNGIDLHAYINSEEGRTYTALSRIPAAVGSDLQSLLAVGDVIGWLFAKARSGLPNGFQLTGGRFNSTAEVSFPQTSHAITISQQFQGLDVFNYLRTNIEIRGSLPSVVFGAKIEVPDHFEEYNLVRPGQFRSRASRLFRLEGNSLEIPFTVDQTISFESCPFWPPEKVTQALRLDVSKNFIVYDDKEQIVRYAASYKTTPVSGKAILGDSTSNILRLLSRALSKRAKKECFYVTYLSYGRLLSSFHLFFLFSARLKLHL